MSDFGKRLRAMRRAANVTQRQLANMLDVSPSVIGKYECFDNAYPTIPRLIKIAEFFKTSVDYLLCGKELNNSADNTVSGKLMNSTVIQTSTVLKSEKADSPEVKELQRIYEELDVRDRLRLLNFAFELEERNNQD